MAQLEEDSSRLRLGILLNILQCTEGNSHTTKNYLFQKINRAEVEIPWLSHGVTLNLKDIVFFCLQYFSGLSCLPYLNLCM